MPKLSPQDWRDILQLDARERRAGLPAGFMTAVLAKESAGDPEAESPAGAQGLFQFMPGTAKRFGIDPYDPFQAADGAERYLSMLYKRYDGDARKALAGYNWGEGNVDKKGLTSLPRETFAYITNVLSALGPRSAEAATPKAQGAAPSFVDSDTFEQWLAQGRAKAQGQQPSMAAPEMPPRAVPGAQGNEALAQPGSAPGVQRITVDIPYGDAPTPSPQPAPGASVPLTAQGQVSNADALKLQDAQIAQQYGYDPALIQSASGYTPGMLADLMQRGIYAGSPEGFGAEAYQEPSTLGNLVLRAGHGLGGVLTGANQLVQTGLNKVGLGSAGNVALADLRAKMLEASRQKVVAESPTGLGFVAEMTGALAAPAPAIQTGSRLANAAIRGATGAVLSQPALGVSADPTQRDASYLSEKGGQALVGGIGGAAIDTVARGVGGVARALVKQSRGQKALDRAAETNRVNADQYTQAVDDALDSNLTALEAHLNALDKQAAGLQRFENREVQRKVAWEGAAQRKVAKAERTNAQAREAYEQAVREEEARVAAKNAENLARHEEELAGIRKENTTALADYEAGILRHKSAVEGARQVPGQYGPETIPSVRQALDEIPTTPTQRAPGAGSIVDQLYDKTRDVGGTAMVNMGAAREASLGVQNQMAAYGGLQGSPVGRLASAVLELGEETSVTELIPVLREAGKLTRGGDSNTRALARDIFASLHDVIDQSAKQLPETDQARVLLEAATKAARRTYAVSDLSDMVTNATGRNSTGQFPTLNIAQLLRNVERKFASNAPRDKLFANSFTPEERASILGDFERFTGLQSIPQRPPTLKSFPDAPGLLQPKAIQEPAPTVADVLPWRGRNPRPLGLDQPLAPPTLKTIPDVPELAQAQVPPLEISSMVRHVAIGTATGSGIGAIGGLYGQGAAIGAGVAVAGELSSQLFAKALLNPRLRPIILKAVNADGSIDPRVYGYIVQQFAHEQQPMLPQGQ